MLKGKRKLVDDLIYYACMTVYPNKPGVVVNRFRDELLLKELKAEDFQDVRQELLNDGPPTIAGKPRIWRIF